MVTHSKTVAVQDTLYESKNPVRFYLHNRRKSVIMELIGRYGPHSGRGLDIGSGVGTYTWRMLQKCGRVTCVDNDSDLLNFMRDKFGANERLDLLHSDAISLPFKDDTFDLVLCSEVLEHVSSPKSMLREIGRVKKADGRIILSTPQKFSMPELTAKVFFSKCLRPMTEFIVREAIHDPGHVSLQTSSSLQHILWDLGFNVVTVKYTGAFVPVISELWGNRWARFLRKQEEVWAKGMLRPFLWTQIYVLR